jgi:alanine dehydrogenase
MPAMDATLRILTDADVAARADMRALIAVIERALRAKAEGRLMAPPRHRVEFGERGGGGASSNTPVIDAAWLAPGAHVTTIGPKIKGRHELGLDVADRAGLIATDSPAQIAALDFFLDGTDHGTRMVDLADIVTGRHPGRTSDDMIMLFCSAGLAGTEVLVADALLGMS